MSVYSLSLAKSGVKWGNITEAYYFRKTVLRLKRGNAENTDLGTDS